MYSAVVSSILFITLRLIFFSPHIPHAALLVILSLLLLLLVMFLLLLLYIHVA